MANGSKVMASIKDFLIKMKALDEAIPEELAEDALKMTEEVKDALCEDEDPDVLEITNDEDPKEKEDIDVKVEDAITRVLMKHGLIRDSALSALDELEEEVTVEDEDNEEEVTVDPEKMNDSLRRKIIRDMKPVLASIKDAKERKKAVDAFVGAMKQNTTTTDAYGKIMKAKVASAKDNAAKSKVDDSSDYELGMQIAKKFNPHYKEEN